MESSTPTALAIPHEELLPSFQKYCLDERMVQAFQREPCFRQLQYRLHQVYFVNEFSRRELNEDLSIRQLLRPFGCDDAQIKTTLVNVLDNSKVGAVIWPLTVVQKAKFWNVLKRKPKNANQSQE
jgi:hypothetical protein